ELDRALGHQEPHWKEFRFDLTQIPAGEAVTAAEFRIYKLPSTRLLNRTLHVSMFEVVREQANRESDLFFLDLQTLRAGDEGWLVLDVTAASDRWLLNPPRLKATPFSAVPLGGRESGRRPGAGRSSAGAGRVLGEATGLTSACRPLCGQVHLMKPDAVPKACCAPTKLSATSVLYYDSSNNVILRKHRNMVVKACGCH
ncbi:bone morphogenetic protein 8A, partial [Pteropus alecto]|uniref:bone morphogenetic protein 8A n=1 Tax=Pteropus alecto TaxID=9402 RepID=UPI000D53A321